MPGLFPRLELRQAGRVRSYMDSVLRAEQKRQPRVLGVRQFHHPPQRLVRLFQLLRPALEIIGPVLHRDEIISPRPGGPRGRRQQKHQGDNYTHACSPAAVLNYISKRRADQAGQLRSLAPKFLASLSRMAVMRAPTSASFSVPVIDEKVNRIVRLREPAGIFFPL